MVVGLDEVDEHKQADEQILVETITWFIEVSDRVDIKLVEVADITEVEVEDDGIEVELEVL